MCEDTTHNIWSSSISTSIMEETSECFEGNMIQAWLPLSMSHVDKNIFGHDIPSIICGLLPLRWIQRFNCDPRERICKCRFSS